MGSWRAQFEVHFDLLEDKHTRLAKLAAGL